MRLLSSSRVSTPMGNWLPSLITPAPIDGYDLAAKLSRMAIKRTQSDAAVRDRLHLDYADALIAVSAVITAHFTTIVATSGYWRDTR